MYEVSEHLYRSPLQFETYLRAQHRHVTVEKKPVWKLVGYPSHIDFALGISNQTLGPVGMFC